MLPEIEIEGQRLRGIAAARVPTRQEQDRALSASSQPVDHEPPGAQERRVVLSRVEMREHARDHVVVTELESRSPGCAVLAHRRELGRTGEEAHAERIDAVLLDEPVASVHLRP